MIGVTLYDDERYLFVSDLVEEQRDKLSYALYQKFKSSGMEDKDIREAIDYFVKDARIIDLEKTINLHYVDRNRDFSSVVPVNLSNKESAQPLLDALSRGDFELAKHLTPNKYRLCGFEVVPEDNVITRYREYAAYYDDYLIPAGVYPVFANKFNIDENYKGSNGIQFTNKLKDFQGLSIISYGVHISGNPPVKTPEESVVFDSPYAHVIGKIALDKLNGSIQMIKPFKAIEINFVSSYDNRELTTYGIIDSDLDDRLFIDPMKLKNGLDSMIDDGVFSVERLRFSVTQGEAAVYCNGHKVAQFGDEMWLRNKDGSFSNGHRSVEFSPDLSQNYREIIGGWGSIKSDKDFVQGAIRVFPKEVKKALDSFDKKISLEHQIESAEIEKRVVGNNIVNKGQER